MHWTYIFVDPKTGLPRYVGKGLNERPFDHFKARTRLGAMLRKRQIGGFSPRPILLSATSNEDAVEMEMLLISLIGREDTGEGPLFNLTDGGEGCPGRKRSAESLLKQSSNKKRFYESTDARQITAEATRKSWLKRPRVGKAKKKACTLDGITIYASVSDLIQEHGQGVRGYRSPSFRYV